MPNTLDTSIKIYYYIQARENERYENKFAKQPVSRYSYTW